LTARVALDAIDAAFGDAPRREFAESKLALFTGEQRAAVIAFLEAMCELNHDDAAKALGYWRG
jgi:hypothetical protein